MSQGAHDDGLTAQETLDALDAYGETHAQGMTGHVFLLKWLKEGPWGEAAQHIIWQFVIFYLILLVGFGFLYLMIRSTAQIREIRKNVADALRAQRDRKFGVDDGGAYMAYSGMA